MAVVTYNVSANVAALSVKGEVVSADGQARAVPLKIVKASDVERGGGRKLMLSWKPEGLAPGRYVLKVAVSGAGENSAAFEVR